MTTLQALGALLKRGWQSWCNFWVRPGDPTTMAFLRIIGGSLCFYVHLIYTFDLQSFFGKNAWYDLATANRIRAEEPTRYPILSWDHQANYDSVLMPDGIANRKLIADWLRGLPADKPGLRKALRLIDTEGVLNEADAPNYPATGVLFRMEWFALEYLKSISPVAKVRADTLDALRDPAKRDRREKVPEVFDLMLPTAKLKMPMAQTTPPTEEMAKFTVSLEEFYRTLPQDDGSGKSVDNPRGRQVVLTYLQELTSVLKNNLLRFLATTRDGAELGAQREPQLDYLEYWGVEKRAVLASGRIGQPWFSLWYHITNPTAMAFTHAGVLLVILMFTLGLYARVTSVLTWLAAASYIHRNPQVLFGQDTMMNILLLYLAIAKSGATLSLDRLIECRRARRASLARTGTIDARTQRFLDQPPPCVSSHLAQRMLQVHFCFIYMASGLAKLKGGMWWSHNDAIWSTLLNPEFTMIHFEWYRELVRSVFTSRPLFSLMSSIGVFYTLFVEISLPYLVWTKLRPWIIILGFGLHIGIGIFMGLLVFSLFMMTMLAAFIPGWAIREMLFEGKHAK